METCFLNPVLHWSVSVLLLGLGLPGPLWAGTPGYNSTNPVTDGFYYSSGTDGPSSTENGATSASYSSESLSPSQRVLLLTHTSETHSAPPGTLETEQTEILTETSSRFPETTNLSTEPFTSSSISTTDFSSSSSSSSSSGFTNTNQMPVMSHSVSTENQPRLLPEDETLPQDSPDTTLRLRDTTSSMSQTGTLTIGTYTTTVSRAGERTLLSVTSSSSNNSTSSAFTEDSSSHQPLSTWGIPPRPAETEGYTQSAPATRTNGRETTEQHMTGTFSETGGPAGASGTPGLTRQPNSTKHQLSLTSQETSDSTPPLKVTEPSTDQSETPVSSTPPFTSHAEGPVNASGTDRDSGSSVGSSTEMTTGAHSPSTQNQEGTEGLTSQTREDSVGLGLTTVPSAVSSSSEMNESPTEMPGMVTGVFLTTTPVTVTERSQTTEENTFKSAAFTTTTRASTEPPIPATSATMLSSTSRSYTTESTAETTLPPTSTSTTVPTPDLQSSAALPTVHVSPSQTQRPSTKMVIPTKAATVQTETSTGTQRFTTTQSQYVKTTYSHSSPAGSTESVHTSTKQTDGGATELEVTTLLSDVQTAKVPQRNPCVSNPCMNGGMCVSYKGPEYTCQCQKAWTGPTCDQDLDECEQDPCPAGSTCVNTNGSFSCECPLGYDLEDGRTCTRAKTFLGTFNFNRHDHIKSSAMHEIQREIIQLLNVSLSVLQGYSRSTLLRKEQGRVRILAVSMFSVSTDVTTAEVYNSIQMSLSNCSASLTHCRMVLQNQLSYHMESLCEAQKTQCDKERSNCTDSTGTAYCQCLRGYYKHNPEDLSCLECRDGYKLENGTCVPLCFRCMFGFGGFNCGNFYKLIAVVVSPAGGGLLLILIIALIVTCCKKDKNDINKIIFKSGDMQMSPYADFPKNNRISMEWGRETIEMQENGSTKNLLQMTDIYYSPALRNSDLERNGLYPFTGLPGSRHSCIYPAQWNPSFISDDSRRRDYF
ncbi:protein HEG isoform X1 [Girardinichthys multiradiatus]|uniref:protein HEG isoform X1 n=1 Tax=Girardinichthys multiradiatus TaxID=208333 RepID=UPI001FAE2EFE|nr:protein HEG isoform X1 [Girardinichthys multiradiatus]